jgi:hypothetical protein
MFSSENVPGFPRSQPFVPPREKIVSLNAERRSRTGGGVVKISASAYLGRGGGDGGGIGGGASSTVPAMITTSSRDDMGLRSVWVDVGLGGVPRSRQIYGHHVFWGETP